MTALRRHLPTLLPASIIVGAVALVLWKSTEARQVAGEALGLLFTFFTTPFILETSLALIGLMTVLVINQRRRDREQDEWVEMEVPTKPKATGENLPSQD
ncbi:MAG: hypothetical protein JWO94_2260 [Verrucomicrobiaceae bacterium]|nr:hypothetical protein [Verrucomicrobiaceae bacterium]